MLNLIFKSNFLFANRTIESLKVIRLASPVHLLSGDRFEPHQPLPRILTPNYILDNQLKHATKLMLHPLREVNPLNRHF